jgi:predicted amidohydrolase YtcJ
MTAMRKFALLLAWALPALAQQPPDLIIINAKVYTADPANRTAEAIAIRGDRIVGVGTTQQILSMAEPKTRTVDAEKHLVVPGFNDAHTHQSPYPMERFTLALNHDPSFEDLQLALGNATEETPEGPWIMGSIGPKILSDARVNGASLDKASHNRKVVLVSFTGHGIVMSGTAMQALHLGGSDPMGGWFERDAGGRLTGKAFEYADDAVMRKLADTVSDADESEQLRAYVDNALRHGVTSIQNMSHLSALRYDKVLRHTAFPMRIRLIRFPGTSASGPDLTDGATLPVTSRERPLDTIMGWKWILDGTPIEQGAATRTNYANTTANGRINFTPEQLATLVKAAFASPQQWLFHVSGDRTTAALFEAMRAVAPPEQWRAKRVRIEHGDGLLPDLIPVAKDFGVVVVVNPTHFMAKSLYPKGAYMPLRSLLKAGIPVAIGSDDDPNPFRDLAAAVAHPDPAESITLAEAIDLYTRGSAYAEFAENDKGTIANGKLADLAVLSQDILGKGNLAETASMLTIVNGTIVYNAAELPVKRADDVRK